ncbi:MAG TPA: NYN domain-containing protein [Pyrinomonadaceae bacterium]|nr:NYN domain-containing protein [Pyrinomonadaceae bacterium]
MKTNIYVDGFNLYFRCLQGTPCKWLDIAKMCHLLLPHNVINEIKYFTANVTARPGDPGQPLRQQIYLRALQTIPNLSIIRGTFLTSQVRMLRVGYPPEKDSSYVKVIKTEEKGSDVNLATHLLYDACMGNFECAAVVSKDSDLLEPIRIVREKLGLPVGLLNPGKKKSLALIPHVDFIKEIRRGVLEASQFPDELEDINGTFYKPGRW